MHLSDICQMFVRCIGFASGHCPLTCVCGFCIWPCPGHPPTDPPSLVQATISHTKHSASQYCGPAFPFSSLLQASPCALSSELPCPLHVILLSVRSPIAGKMSLGHHEHICYGSEVCKPTPSTPCTSNSGLCDLQQHQAVHQVLNVVLLLW